MIEIGNWVVLILLFASLSILHLFHFKTLKKGLPKIYIWNVVSRQYDFISKGRYYIFILGLSFLFLGVSNITFKYNNFTEVKESSETLILLDLSKSMTADDVKPTRIDIAKRIIYQIIEKSTDKKFGLVVFAGKAYLQVPLTYDKTPFQLVLNQLTPSDLPEKGTSLENALIFSNSILNEDNNLEKNIILISDGEEKTGKALSEIDHLRLNDIKIYSVSIGTKNGAYLREGESRNFIYDHEGMRVISKVNLTVLEKLSEATNGEHYHYENNEDDISLKVCEILGSN